MSNDDSVALSTKMFDLQLEMIEKKANNDETKLVALLTALNIKIDNLRKSLLGNIRVAVQEAENLPKAFEALRDLYPVFWAVSLGERIPVLKIPSVKVVLIPKVDKWISIQEIKELFPKHEISKGDCDYYIPIERREISAQRQNSVCIYPNGHLENMVEEIKWIKETINNFYSNYRCKFEIVVKPSYRSISIEQQFVEQYPDAIELLQKRTGAE